VKISTLFLFSRIFPGRQFRLLLYTVGLFVVTYSGIMVLGAIFQCVPIQEGWDTTVKAKCIQINLLWEIMAGMNVLTDFVLLLAPLPTLWKLQMQRTMKWQLISLFCVGGLYVQFLPTNCLELLANLLPVSAPSQYTAFLNSMVSPSMTPPGPMLTPPSGRSSKSASPSLAPALSSIVLYLAGSSVFVFRWRVRRARVRIRSHNCRDGVVVRVMWLRCRG